MLREMRNRILLVVNIIRVMLMLMLLVLKQLCKSRDRDICQAPRDYAMVGLHKSLALGLILGCVGEKIVLRVQNLATREVRGGALEGRSSLGEVQRFIVL